MDDDPDQWVESARSPGEGRALKSAASVRLYVIADNVLWVSTNGGGSWTMGASGVGAVNMIAVSPADDDTLYVAASSGLYRSTDAGVTLTQLDTGLSVSFQLVAISPTRPTTVYAALSQPIPGGTVTRLSLDGGNTWKTLGSLPLVQPDWMQVQAHRLYLGTSAGVWRIVAR